MQVPESVHFYPKNRPKNSHSSSLEYYNTQLKIKFFHKKHLALSSILLFRDINVHSGTCIPQLKQKDRTYICPQFLSNHKETLGLIIYNWYFGLWILRKNTGFLSKFLVPKYWTSMGLIIYIWYFGLWILRKNTGFLWKF